MNYLLFHIGKLPKHFYTCVNNILSVDSQAKIYLGTDTKVSIKGVNVVDINEFDYLVDKKEKILSTYRNTQLENNPLWYTSFLRIYALRVVAEHFGIKKFIHFDNDILIYEPFYRLEECGLVNSNKINITELNSNNLVFGYSYFDNFQNLDFLEGFFDKVLNDHKSLANNYNRGAPLNEMRVLKLAQNFKPDYFSILPSLPYESDFLFDPASYGQFLNGTNNNRGNYIFKRRSISTDHIVGRELKSKRISVKFKDKRPIVYFDNQAYKLVNLHIHSKNLSKFVSNEYNTHLVESS